MRIKGKQLEDELRSEGAPFSRLHATQLTGALVYKAKNASTLEMTVGQAVYISGRDGEVPEILLADADGIGSTPAAGLVATGGNAGAETWVISEGELKGVDTSSFSEGDTLYVSTAPGVLANSPPTGESAKLQNIGRVVRSHESSGVVRVGGAGRTAATPNLNQNKIFLGDANNRSTSTALSAIALSSFNNDLGLATSSDDITSDHTGVNYTGADGATLTAHLAGIDTALSNVGGAVAPTLIDSTAITSLTINTDYVISPTITGSARVRVPAHGAGSIVDGSTIIVTNLSAHSVQVSLYDTSGQGALYYADGTAAPTTAIYTRQLTIEAQGTIRLYQAGAGDPVKWYCFTTPAFEVESETSSLTTGDALNYDTGRKAFLSAGAVHGEVTLTGNISKAIYARHKYVTAYDETTARTLQMPDMYSALSYVEGLDGKRFYIENRGQSTLTIEMFDEYNFQNGIVYRSYLRNFDNTAISGNDYVLQAGERVAIETSIENVNATFFQVIYRLGKFTPVSVTETDTSGTNSTITHGNEDRLTYIVNTANDVSITLPSVADCKPSYEITVKSIGTGTTTLLRAGSNTFDGLTSLSLSQNEMIALTRSTTSTWIITSTRSPESSGDLLSDHTGVNYTGADTDTLTTHLAGIDSELNDRADTVNSIAVVNGAVTIGSDDIVGEHTGVNYTAANTDSITTHLAGIDTALASAGGGGGAPSITTLSGNATETLGVASGSEEIYLLNQTNVDVYINSASSVGEGFKYTFKNVVLTGFESPTIHVNASSSDTIDDGTATSIDVGNIYDAITLVSDGTSQWYVI